MCVTSPPYWGLRDYGVEGQLGLEKTPEEYVANMVEVFRLVRDVLADDGTLWLNMGDSYGSGARTTWRSPTKTAKHGYWENPAIDRRIPSPAKQLLGTPWRLAFALQADGWYLRSDIIWHKPNPMPESVTDRPTKAHEYLFLLSKRERYYYDIEAIKEPAKYNGPNSPESIKSPYGQGFTRQAQHPRVDHRENHLSGGFPYSSTDRNRRSVWTISTQPYAGAHFATFPEALVEPCVLAGSRSGDVVLDPFFGSGTVGQVAERLGRQWVGIELNSEYADMAKIRTAQQGLVLG